MESARIRTSMMQSAALSVPVTASGAQIQKQPSEFLDLTSQKPGPTAFCRAPSFSPFTSLPPHPSSPSSLSFTLTSLPYPIFST